MEFLNNFFVPAVPSQRPSKSKKSRGEFPTDSSSPSLSHPSERKLQPTYSNNAPHASSPIQIIAPKSTISVSSTPPNSPRVDGMAAHSIAQSHPSRAPQPHWETLSRASDLRQIINYPSLTDTQIKNAKRNLFVPLACFLPLADSAGVPSAPPSSSPHDEESLLAQLTRQMHSDDPSFILQKRKAELKNTPHFYRWDQVILAFVGGLIPTMCFDRPDRLSDYSAFIVSVIAEHSRNNENDWPVFLRYIEETRRKALIGTDNHSLMASSPPSDQILQISLFQKIRVDYASPNKTKFLEDFVHPSVLKPPTQFTRHSDISPSPSPPATSPSQSPKSSRTPTFPPQGFTEAQWEKATRSPALREAFCRNALVNLCKPPCPHRRPHKTTEEVLKLL
jgi:hypothetical protein